MEYLKEIKNLIEKNEINQRKYNYYKNESLVETYFNIGKLLVEAQGGKERAKYGNKLIKTWSVELTKLYGNGYNYTNLCRFRQFYITFEKVAPLAQQLTWTNICTLLPIKEENKRNYYINLCIKQNLSKRGLIELIKSNSYERLSISDKENIKLIDNAQSSVEIVDYIKNPIYIETDKNITNLDEKLLHELIIEHLENFYLELGIGYTFVGSEYKLGNHRCDLLLFNLEYLGYVVIELKIRKLEPKDIGQITHYMNYIDRNLKKDKFNKTIGIIITKEDDKFVLSYCSNKNVYNTTYKLVNKDKINV